MNLLFCLNMQELMARLSNKMHNISGILLHNRMLLIDFELIDFELIDFEYFLKEPLWLMLF